MLVYGAGAASFCLEPEPTQVGRSRSWSRLRDLGHQEPEPPKKVVAPQHCFSLQHPLHIQVLTMAQVA